MHANTTFQSVIYMFITHQNMHKLFVHMLVYNNQFII